RRLAIRRSEELGEARRATGGAVTSRLEPRIAGCHVLGVPGANETSTRLVRIVLVVTSVSSTGSSMPRISPSRKAAGATSRCGRPCSAPKALTVARFLLLTHDARERVRRLRPALRRRSLELRLVCADIGAFAVVLERHRRALLPLDLARERHGIRGIVDLHDPDRAAAADLDPIAFPDLEAVREVARVLERDDLARARIGGIRERRGLVDARASVRESEVLGARRIRAHEDRHGLDVAAEVLRKIFLRARDADVSAAAANLDDRIAGGSRRDEVTLDQRVSHEPRGIAFEPEVQVRPADSAIAVQDI